MNSTSLASAPVAKRSALLPLGVALLAAASYAAGVVTPSIVGSATIKSSDTTTVTAAQPRQGPPDDQLPGVKAQRQGPPDDQVAAGKASSGESESTGH